MVITYTMVELVMVGRMVGYTFIPKDITFKRDD
jgi:hypothetical protein